MIMKCEAETENPVRLNHGGRAYHMDRGDDLI
jgi:hypothetical protein